MRFLEQMWTDFLDFWKTQMFGGLLVSLVAAIVQLVTGVFSGSIKDKLLDITFPYLAIGGLFVIGNAGRTLFKKERDSPRQRMRSQRREEHRSAIAASKLPAILPNLQFRRVFLDDVFVGPEIGGRKYPAFVVEIGNELLTNRAVGPANRVKAHVTYLDDQEKRLHIVCPGRWTTQNDEAYIQPGESATLVLASLNSCWTSGLYTGVEMQPYKKIEVRLLGPDEDGQLLAEMITLEFRLDEHSRYSDPSCIKSWAAGSDCCSVIRALP